MNNLPIATQRRTLRLLLFTWIILFSYSFYTCYVEIRPLNKANMLQNKETVASDDSRLLRMLRGYFIETQLADEYNASVEDASDKYCGLSAPVDKALHRKTHGFFIESYAQNGEHSPTVFFERVRHWTGLLIEPNVTLSKSLKHRHRKAFILNACIGTKSYAIEKTQTSSVGSRIVKRDTHTQENVRDREKCFPLYSILLALNRLTVDYFHLHIDDPEEAVLKSLPWNKINVKVWSIDYTNWTGGETALSAFMKQHGYDVLTKANESCAKAVLYMKRS